MWLSYLSYRNYPVLNWTLHSPPCFFLYSNVTVSWESISLGHQVQTHDWARISFAALWTPSLRLHLSSVFQKLLPASHWIWQEYQHELIPTGHRSTLIAALDPRTPKCYDPCPVDSTAHSAAPTQLSLSRPLRFPNCSSFSLFCLPPNFPSCIHMS